MSTPPSITSADETNETVRSWVTKKALRGDAVTLNDLIKTWPYVDIKISTGAYKQMLNYTLQLEDQPVCSLLTRSDPEYVVVRCVCSSEEEAMMMKLRWSGC